MLFSLKHFCYVCFYHYYKIDLDNCKQIASIPHNKTRHIREAIEIETRKSQVQSISRTNEYGKWDFPGTSWRLYWPTDEHQKKQFMMWHHPWRITPLRRGCMEENQTLRESKNEEVNVIMQTNLSKRIPRHEPTTSMPKILTHIITSSTNNILKKPVSP